MQSHVSLHWPENGLLMDTNSISINYRLYNIVYIKSRANALKENDKECMEIVATQVTKDVLRLPGHEVPASSKTIESIIGDDPIDFTNLPLRDTEISESDVDEDPKI